MAYDEANQSDLVLDLRAGSITPCLPEIKL